MLPRARRRPGMQAKGLGFFDWWQQFLWCCLLGLGPSRSVRRHIAIIAPLPGFGQEGGVADSQRMRAIEPIELGKQAAIGCAEFRVACAVTRIDSPALSSSVTVIVQPVPCLGIAEIRTHRWPDDPSFHRASI